MQKIQGESMMCKEINFLMLLVLNVIMFVNVSAYKIHNSLCFIFSFKINITFKLLSCLYVFLFSLRRTDILLKFFFMFIYF